MKTLVLAVAALLTISLCNPVMAWEEYHYNDIHKRPCKPSISDQYYEDLRLMQEENYRRRMLEIQEELLWIETMRDARSSY